MRTFRLPAPEPELAGRITRLWVAPDSKRIAALFGSEGDENWNVACWEDVAQAPIWQADLHDLQEDYPESEFSPDLRWVVSLVGDRNAESASGNLFVVPVTQSAQPRVFLGTQTDAPTPQLPVFSADGQFLYAVVGDKITRRVEIAYWDAPSLFVTCADKRASSETRVPPVADWAIGLNLRGTFRNPSCLAVSPDGRFLAWGSFDGTVTVCNLASGSTVIVLRVKLRGHVSPWVLRLAFTRDGSRLAILRRRSTQDGTRNEVTMCEPKRGAEERKVRESESVNGMAFSVDGSRLFTACCDGSVGVWGVAKVTKLREYRWKIGELFCVVVAPDGLTCAAGGENGQVVVWDVDS